MSPPDLFQEADRQLVICNACRYCEGYCPVFPAIEMRREFDKGDVFYLANLCHDCRACYYACMYTAPHEFDINIPRMLSEVRTASYARWSWPALLSRSFTSRRAGVTFATLVTGVVIALSLLLVSPARIFGLHTGPGAFYQVVPYLAMVLPAVLLFLYAIGIWINGGARFWSDTGRSVRHNGGLKAVTSALGSILSLRYLKGGGPGCYYPQQRASQSRRIYHSLVFWGFLSAAVSTTLAGIYQDILHWIPPYPLTSAPVVFGSLGGIALIVGTSGLIWIKLKSDPGPAGDGALGMDYIFLALLGLTALTGMLTLALRFTTALGSILILHLALIAALFITAPYGKFVHAVYRSLALVRYRLETDHSSQ